MPAETEGVIKYQLDHQTVQLEPAEELSGLVAWRAVLHRLGLVGQDPDRYGGYGFGNVSLRLDAERFVISGTQTGAPEWLGAAGYAEVLHCDVEQNRVRSRGEVRPSSESLTHGAVYRLNPGIGCILHAHSPEIWSQAEALGLPATPAQVPYGTPAMAAAVARLYHRRQWREQGLFTMAGHEDGVVAFGPDPDSAGREMVSVLARAMGAAAPRFRVPGSGFPDSD